MQAVVIHQFGEPKSLRIEDVPTPKPGEGEALVEVRAAGINPSDVKNVAGTMHGTTLPRIPGRDFAGVVVAGPNNFVGKDVWGTGGDIGYTRDGSHAQFILIPSAALTPKPARLSMDEAASAGLVFVTAWSALVTSAAVTKGNTALIIGAAGGVGTAAVQIAKARGARVIGAVRSDDEFPTARSNGADEVINTRSTKLPDAVRAMTNGRGADVVFDSSGMMFADAIESAAMGARLAVITAPKDGQVTFNLRTIYRKELRIGGVDSRRLDVIASGKLLALMAPQFESGQFKARAGKPYPLAKAIEAYEQASQGGTRILLRPNESK